eukprot:5119716-Heterocapsa_arctica.AAC.1
MDALPQWVRTEMAAADSAPPSAWPWRGPVPGALLEQASLQATSEAAGAPPGCDGVSAAGASSVLSPAPLLSAGCVSPRAAAPSASACASLWAASEATGAFPRRDEGAFMGGPPQALSKYMLYINITQQNTSCSSTIQK